MSHEIIEIEPDDDKIELSNDGNDIVKDDIIDDEDKIVSSNSKDKNGNDITNDGINKDENNKDENKSINLKHISMMEILPKGKYLVTYSKENKTIIGLNIVKGKLQPDSPIKAEVGDNEKISHMCVSDQKELAYINNYHYIGKYN